MARLTWAPSAVQDLDTITAQIARTSDTYARTFAQQVTALVESIPQQPRLGARVEEWDQEEIRERLYPELPGHLPLAG